MGAATLPTRLLNFFARYPPELYSAKITGITIPLTRAEAKAAAASRTQFMGTEDFKYQQPISPPTSTSTTETEPILSNTTPETAAAIANIDSAVAPVPEGVSWPPNPFLPTKIFTTGKWAGPKIGLRRQAELVKLAKINGVEELLPPGKKSTAFKETRLIKAGLRIRGTGEGQKVKGHKWERTIGTTLEKRRKAMEGMPEMIRTWKQVSMFYFCGKINANGWYREGTAEVGRSIQNKSLLF
jgi:large subunit ribosomal protein L25